MYKASRLSHNWLIKEVINNELRKRLPSLNGLILDLGCGDRPFEHDILQHAHEYIGVDWSNTLHNLRADIVADLNKPLPIRNNYVDHVVTLEVMEHLSEPRIMLSEALRVLRPRGGLTLSVPFQWWTHEAPWDFYRYTNFGLKYLLEQAGFIEILIKPTTGFWSMWLLKLNYQTARLIRGPRVARILMRALLIPFWYLSQRIAPVLDRAWQEDRETAGYFVTARKP